MRTPGAIITGKRTAKAQPLPRQKASRDLPKSRGKKPRPPEGAALVQYHHGDLREAMIECGLKLLEAEGCNTISLRGAARLAGVSSAAPKHHFKNKEGLLAAIAARGFYLLTTCGIGDVAAADAAEQRLRGMIRGYVGFAVERPALFDLMFGSVIKDKAEYPELESAAARAFAYLYEAVHDFVSGVDDSEQRFEKQSFMVWCALHGLATLLIHARRGQQLAGRRVHDLSADLSDYVIQGIVSGSNERNIRRAPSGPEGATG